MLGIIKILLSWLDMFRLTSFTTSVVTFSPFTLSPFFLPLPSPFYPSWPPKEFCDSIERLDPNTFSNSQDVEYNSSKQNECKQKKNK